MFGQWELLHIDFGVLSNVIFWPLIASWLAYMITLQLLLGWNMVYGGTSQISLPKVWRTWEISTLCGIIRWQVRTGIVSWIFSEFQLGIRKKRNIISTWRFCSLVGYLLGSGDMMLMLGMYIWVRLKSSMWLHCDPISVLLLESGQRLIGSFSELLLCNYKMI